MVTPIEYIIEADAPAPMTPALATELSAHFNRANAFGNVTEHPDLASGVGYQVGALIDTADAAAVFGEFWSVTWKAAVDAGELRGGFGGARAPRLGPDVLMLCVESPMPYTAPTGEQSVFKAPWMQELVGTLRAHPLGVQLVRHDFALVLQFDMSVGDLRALHLHLEERNAAFGF
jgi:hypothetical protein